MSNTDDNYSLSKEAQYALMTHKKVTIFYEAYQKFRDNVRKKYYGMAPPVTVILKLHELFAMYTIKFIVFNERIQDIEEEDECIANIHAPQDTHDGYKRSTQNILQWTCPVKVPW